jgi:cytochrome c peroxidase
VTRLARLALLGIALYGEACTPASAADDREPWRAAFGRMLFFDPALSGDGQVACSTCHQPAHAYSDGRVRAVGIAGRGGTRNTPSLLDVGRQRTLFWDGRRTRLEDQALDPLLDDREHGLGDPSAAVAAVRRDPRYAAAVEAAYGVGLASVTPAQLAGALAAFERSLVSEPAPFDRFQAGDRDALPETARHGWQIFDERARCSRCHIATAEDGPPLFTDHQFHSLAVGLGKIERKLPALSARLVTSRGSAALGREILHDPDLAELGRFTVTLDPQDLAAFKTPGLRNVTCTAPYMHDGSVPTLADAVDLEVYNRGTSLTPVERADLLAFLSALTSSPCAP